MTTKITPAELGQGGWYALEQCGHLLNDAVSLFDLGRYSTAVGLAMLAREEYGKARRLFALAADGQDIDADDVVITRHIDKQKLALVSVMLPPSDSSDSPGLVDLLRHLRAQQFGTPEWAEAARVFAVALEPVVARLAGDRHQARMRSLYVDWEPTSGRWLRPDVTRDDARFELDYAINDYTTYERNIDIDMSGTLRPAVAALLNQWPERPSLPPPQRPKWP